MNLPPLVPVRVALLPVRVWLPAGEEGLAFVAARLVEHLLFRSLAEHPAAAFRDPFGGLPTDSDGLLWTIDHPEIEQHLWHLWTAERRDEVLWFELDLDTSRPERAELKSRRAGRTETESFDATACSTPEGATLSATMAAGLKSWERERGLPSSPRTLEPFTRDDVLLTIRRAAQCFQLATTDLDACREMVLNHRVLLGPFLRLVAPLFERVAGQPVDAAIGQLDSEDPEVRRARLEKGRERGDTGSADVTSAIRATPMWFRPYLLLRGDDVAPRQALAAQATASTLGPEDARAWTGLADELIRAGRHAEALRAAWRAVKLSPRLARAHLLALRALRSLGRHGELLAHAQASWRVVDTAWYRTPGLERFMAGEEPEVDGARVGLMLAHALHDTGRLDEAVRQALEIVERSPALASEAAVMAELHTWRTGADEAARAFAREGHSRGDFGRVLVGFGRAGALRGQDAAMLVDALISLGRESLAPLALAHLHGAGLARRPKARLAACRALLLNGQLEPALRELQSVQFGAPQARHDAEIERCLRLAATFKGKAWRRAVERRRDDGAARLAQSLDRDAADFVSGYQRVQLADEAEASTTSFDVGWLPALATTLGAFDTDGIDRLFGAEQPRSLKGSDAVGTGWRELVTMHESPRARAIAAVYVLANALGRYLVGVSGPADVRLSGLRESATGALDALHIVGAHVPSDVIWALLDVLDRAAAGAPSWLVDHWLLRVERALDIEASQGALLATKARQLPTISQHLRGDERMLVEYRYAEIMVQRRDRKPMVRELLERSLRAIGGSHAARQLADAGMRGDEPSLALDDLWTAVTIDPDYGDGWHALAGALLASGRMAAGFEAALTAVEGADSAARHARLEALEPVWRTAEVPVPFTRAEAASDGAAALADGRPDDAALALRWAWAQAPADAVVGRALAQALAMLGDAPETLRVLARMDSSDAPRRAATLLANAEQWPAAVMAYRYSTIYFSEAQDWLALGGAAWCAGNDEIAATAYEQAYDLTGGKLFAAQINALAMALYGTGRFDRCRSVARRLLKVAGEESVWIAFGSDAMARALLGLGRGAEAVEWAEKAVAANPHPDAAAQFDETLDRARRGDPYPVRAFEGMSVEERAWRLLRDGDFQGAYDVASRDRSWGLWRIQSIARGFRYPAENTALVAEDAVRAARTTVEATSGYHNRIAVLCRIGALRVIEHATFPVDPPPQLGERWLKPEYEARVSVGELETR